MLAGLLALLAIATLAHATVTAVRSRRRDLAILKTLGFVRSQVQATVAFQTSALMVVALVVGVPVGVAAGRWTWRVFADSLGIVQAPVLLLTLSLGIVPVDLIVANLIDAGPGRMASQIRPATALKAEEERNECGECCCAPNRAAQPVSRPLRPCAHTSSSTWGPNSSLLT